MSAAGSGNGSRSLALRLSASRTLDSRTHRQYAFAQYTSAWSIYSFHARAVHPFRPPPGGWSFPSDHSKVLAQMRLIHKSTSKRDVA